MMLHIINTLLLLLNVFNLNYTYIAFIFPIPLNIKSVNDLLESKNANETKLWYELTNLIDILVSTMLANRHFSIKEF